MASATTDTILDVTLLEPRQKHPTIFARFDSLEQGESFTIHNDHDPKPLYYQLLGERGNSFNWEYLEQGPEWWKVKISKHPAGEPKETLGQIAAKDIRKAQVFKKYGLDFCCGGKKTLDQACAEKGLDLLAVERELQQADHLAASTRPIPYQDWSSDFLADYIVNTHHSYVKRVLPDMRHYAAKVQRVHGDRHPELNTIQPLVEALANELSSHLVKEEQILFPYIKELVAVKNQKDGLTASRFGSIENPVHMMEHEHDTAGSILEQIRQLTDNYTLPQDACASYDLLYRMLSEFEEDLHLHVHLENNILFPAAIDLEKSLLN